MTTSVIFNHTASDLGPLLVVSTSTNKASASLRRVLLSDLDVILQKKALL